ncbi:unnamed protein product [marine sediment metagenome]|uniref:Uncharacterized protein n=1 Tax=marine sediment metagenome TaxID=412755 RepID=X1KJ68_9ZZZZ
MVTPIHATFTFRGMTGKTYTKDAYISDVANALVNFDSGIGASATSDTFFIAPEPCHLVDVSIITGPTVIGRLQVIRNSVPTGDILDLTTHVSTIAQRPRLMIGFNKGSKVAAIQLAV